jgi:hypothetical protein
MRIFLLLALASLAFTACNNHGKAKTFCDTTCSNGDISFKGDEKFDQSLILSIKNCQPDTLSWTHGRAPSHKKIQLTEFLNQPLKLNQKNVSCGFQDTSMVWLAFNDCVTGRGYLLKLPYNQNKSIQKITSALNSFDPKFSVDPDLRAYTDRGNIYVADVHTGKEAEMTFKKEYDMDFNDIHKAIDTINVTKKRIYVKLIDKDGKEVPLEKNIDL